MNINDEKAVKVNVGRGLAFEADGASPLNSAAPEGLRKPPLHNGGSGPESGSLGEGGGSDCAAEQVIRDGSFWRALLQVLRRSEWWAQRKSPGEQTEAVQDLRAAVKQARAMADTLSDGDGVPLGGLWKAAQRCFAHGEGQFGLLTAEKLRRELDSTCQSLGEALQRVSELEQRLETDTDASMVNGFALAVRELARKHEASSELAERVGAQLESVVCALKRAGAEDLESLGAAVDRLAADRDAWKQDARSALRELLSIGRGPAPEAPPTEPAPPPAPADLRDQYVCEGCRLILRGAGYYVSQVSEAFGEGEAQHCARCGDYLDSSLGAYVGFKVLRDPVELEHVHAAGVSSSKLERLIRETSLQAAREVMQGAPADRIAELETAVANLKLEAEVAASELDGMNRECKRLGEERDRYQELYRAANESAGHILRVGMPEPESEVFGAVFLLWRELCQLARLRHGEPLPEGSFELRLGSWLFTAAVGEVVKLERDGDVTWRVAPGTWLAEFRQPAEEDVTLWVSAFGLLNWQHTPMPQNSGLTSELRELVHDALNDSREPTPLPPEVKS